MVQSLIDMRAQFDDLPRQLSTGQKSATYAGLGLGSGLSVSLNAQLSAIGGFDNTIDMAIDPHQPGAERARAHGEDRQFDAVDAGGQRRRRRQHQRWRS